MGSDESEVSSDEENSSDSSEEGGDGDDDGEGEGDDGGDGDGDGDGVEGEALINMYLESKEEELDTEEEFHAAKKVARMTLRKLVKVCDAAAFRTRILRF